MRNDPGNVVPRTPPFIASVTRHIASVTRHIASVTRHFTPASVTRHLHQSRDTSHPHPMSNAFQYKSQKIDSNSFRHFLSLVLSFIRFRIQICPVPSVLTLSMRPIANPSPVLSTPVPRALAAPVTRRSFVATASPWPSACFAIIHLHIRRFSISDLPSPFSLAISPSTSRTFSLPKNTP